MERNQAIKKLLQNVSSNALFNIIVTKANAQPLNFSLQMASVIAPVSADTKNNWFTAFAVLCINQSVLAGEIIDAAREAEGNPPLNSLAKKELIDAIAAGCKLTKADAGRALD